MRDPAAAPVSPPVLARPQPQVWLLEEQRVLAVVAVAPRRVE